MGKPVCFVHLENIHSLPFEGLCACTQYDWDNEYLVTLFYGQFQARSFHFIVSITHVYTLFFKPRGQKKCA